MCRKRHDKSSRRGLAHVEDFEEKMQEEPRSTFQWLTYVLCAVSMGMISMTAHAADHRVETSPPDHQTPSLSTTWNGPPILQEVVPFDPSQYAGEEVRYSISLMGGEAARGIVNVDPPEQDPDFGPVVAIQGMASSTGLLSAVLKFRYGGQVLAAVQGGRPLWSEKLLEDKGRTRTYTTTFERDAYDARTVHEENDRKTARHYTIPRHVDDVFTWLFRLRSADLRVGQEYMSYMFDGWVVRRLHVRVANHQEAYRVEAFNTSVPAAELVVTVESVFATNAFPWAENAAVLPPIFISNKKPQTVSMWVSLDERQIPLGIAIETPVGNARISLIRYVKSTTAP